MGSLRPFFGFVCLCAMGLVGQAQTPLGMFTGFSPPQLAMNQPLSLTLSWTAVPGAATYDVYLGVSYPSQVATGLTTPMYMASMLAPNSSYIWYVVARNSSGMTTSPPWYFSTGAGTGAQPPPPVTVFTPAQGQPNVSLNASLTWGAVTGATSYDVFFGTSPNMVNLPMVASNLTTTSFTPAGPLQSGTVYYWYVTAKNSAGSTPSALWFFTTTTQSTPTGLRFVPVTPCRVVDTRNAQGPFGGPMIAGGTSRDVPVPSSPCSIPSGAQAYSLNITVVPPGPLTYLTVWPTGQTQPTVSTFNSFDGRIVANAAIVPAGTNGSISVFVSDATHVIIDINGYFSTATTANASAFYALTPCRIADTRRSDLAAGFGQPFMTGNSSRSFPIPISGCSVPGTAQAYSLNVTVVPHHGLGYLTAWPTGAVQPVVSTLNSADGSTLANAAIVPAGTNGAVRVFVTDDTDVIIDIDGYFAAPGSPGALLFVPVTPCRVADTRTTGLGVAFGAPSLAANSTRTFAIASSSCGLPATGTAAYSLNFTVVPSAGQALGFLTAWPAGAAQPTVSTLNSPLGKVLANAAIVPAGTAGGVSVFVTNGTDLVLDVNGYFAAQ